MSEKKALRVAVEVRKRLGCPHFLDRHRNHPKAFTRQRILTFPRVILLVLQKGAKSLQGRLAEFCERLEALAPGEQAVPPVTPGAWCQARAHGLYRAKRRGCAGQLLRANTRRARAGVGRAPLAGPPALRH